MLSPERRKQRAAHSVDRACSQTGIESGWGDFHYSLSLLMNQRGPRRAGAGQELATAPCEANSSLVQAGEDALRRHSIRKELFLFSINTADLSRRAFFNCFLPCAEFALKIYTSLFKNQICKEKTNKQKTPIQNPEKRPEREVRHSRTSA